MKTQKQTLEPTTRNRINRYVVACSAMSAGAVTLTTTMPAEAAVISNTGLSININAAGTAAYIDMDPPFAAGNGGAAPGWDVNPYGRGSRIWTGQSSGRTIKFVALDFDLDLENETAPSLAGGFTVDSSITTWQPSTGYWRDRVLTDLLPGQTGYFGFRFNPDSVPDVGDGLHYGWIQVERSINNTSNGKVLGYGWENQQGAGIQIPVVPEPSSITLLAAGAAGLALMRRRKA